MAYKKDEFYIGWDDSQSEKRKSSIRNWLVLGLILLPSLAFITVYFQKDFNSFVFELGNQKEISGVYYSKPVPFLLADSDDLPQDVSSTIMLIGFGKFGAEGIMEEIEKEKGSLNGKKLTLKGTLIYGDGKCLLELTDKKESYIHHEDLQKANPRIAKNEQVLNFKGEILDPKCYFGVMKPAEGKIHKSCAIRCISGGIPPVLRDYSLDQSNYYILLNKNGEKMNKQLLEYIAEPVRIKGNKGKFLDWDLIYVHDLELIPTHK